MKSIPGWLGIVWLVAGCVSEPPVPAPSAGRSAGALEASGGCPGWYQDEVFRVRFEVACEYHAEVSFENPGSPAGTIKRRVVFRADRGGDLVLDLWENPEGLDLQQWLDRYGTIARYRTGPIPDARPISPGGPLGIREAVETRRSPRKDYAIVGDRSVVVRLMYADLDAGGSQAAYERALRTLRIAEVAP